MLGNLISNALSAGTGNGLITSALCMQIPKSAAKLIIHFDLYEVLKSDLSGFYNMVTSLKTVNIEFSILTASGNAIYTSPKNRYFTNDTEVELPKGVYTIKFLYSEYGFVGGEEQKVTISGETVCTIKLYKRHFKSITVVDNNYDVYHGAMISYYYSDAEATANEVKAISKIDVFELKWDSWIKVLNYNCVPINLLLGKITTHSEKTNTGARHYNTFYCKGIITSESGSVTNSGVAPDHTYSKGFTGRWENDKPIFWQNYSKAFWGTPAGYSEKAGDIPDMENLNYAYYAVTLYHDGKTYSGADSIDDDFFIKYKGTVLQKFQEANTIPQYFLGDPRKPQTTSYTDVVKLYLPTVNYFDESLLQERKLAEQHGNNFWGNINGTAKVNEGDAVTNYNRGKTIYNGLEVTKINSAGNFFWYSDDYS